MVDLHRQYLGIRDEVDRAIGDVIAETAFIKGPAVGLFEEELAGGSKCGTASPVATGTDALLLSLLAVGCSGATKSSSRPSHSRPWPKRCCCWAAFRSSPTSIPALSISTRRASPGWCRSVPVSSSPSICSGSRAIWLRSRPLRRSTA